MTSVIANLLTNCCFAGFSYGIYIMANEESYDFDKPEVLTLCAFIGIVLIFVIFHFRFLHFAWWSEKDSIAYIPSLAANTYVDQYTLLEMLMKLRSRPPMIFLRSQGIENICSERGEDDRTNVVWEREWEMDYGSWRDCSDTIFIDRAGLLDITCEIDYVGSLELENSFEQERIEILRNNTATAGNECEVRTEIEYTTPGYAKHYFATTHGDFPRFIKFMRSAGGHRFRLFMMFIGYHSILEAVWMMMFSRQTIVLRKQISHNPPATGWTGRGETELLDYHNAPSVI